MPYLPPRGGAANNFFKNGLFEKWINNTYFFYITTFFLWKVYYNAILDHLEAWVFKIAPRARPWLALPVTLNFSSLSKKTKYFLRFLLRVVTNVLVRHSYKKNKTKIKNAYKYFVQESALRQKSDSYQV